MTDFQFIHTQTIALKYTDECGLLGIGPDGTLYVEEIYSDDFWMAQHIISADGTFIQTEDEAHGKETNVTPVELPPNARKPQPGFHTNGLNFSGPRHRGLRGPERVADTAHALPLPLKMQLVEQLALTIMPPQLLGVAESYVLSEAQIARPHLFVICRRLRFAYALIQPQTDDDGQPYDYDTAIRHIIQVYHEQDDDFTDFKGALDDFGGVELNHPMDCVIHNDHLYVADSGLGHGQNRVHIWRIAD